VQASASDSLHLAKSDHHGQTSRLESFSSAETAPKSVVIGAGEADRLGAGETRGVGAGECKRFAGEAAETKEAWTRGGGRLEPSALKVSAGPHRVLDGDEAAQAAIDESTFGVRPSWLSSVLTFSAESWAAPNSGSPT
jgi:hypothetical protein